MRVLLLADGGPEAGLGHISRSIGLAAALEERGIATERLVLESPEPPQAAGADAVVLDSYRVAPADLASPAPVVAFHDAGERPTGAALVVDGTRFEHACLRPLFWDTPKRVIRDSVDSVLVATGAAGQLGADLASSVRAALPSSSVTLIRGPYAPGEAPRGVAVVHAPDSLAALLLAADLAVVSAGQTMLEAAASGTPTVAVVLAENQRPQAERLAGLGAVVLADGMHAAAEVEALVADPERRRRISAKAKAVVDGQGARRVAALVEELT